MGSLLPLRYRIQEYHWGSHSFLGSLRGDSVPTPRPEAELWIGVHPRGESEVMWNGSWKLLSRVLLEDVGQEASGAFLLKLLAVAEPLSLQVHPDARQAAAGFEREEEAGVSAASRSYRDRRAKSELLVALEPMWALHGLRRPEHVERDLDRYGLRTLLDGGTRAEREGPAPLRGLVGDLLALGEERTSRLQQEVGRALARFRDAGPDDPVHWMRRLAGMYPGDPAVLAPLLLHLVLLEPGQALFQPPGTLHCYLEGAGVEVMSSSDNVVRAGLTSKSIDRRELVRIASFEPKQPQILEPVALAPGLDEFVCPASDFRLVRLRSSESSRTVWKAESALSLGICTGGAGRLTALGSRETLDLSSGDAFAALAGAASLQLEGDAELYCATGEPGL